ncbi:uncharacterized protein EI90DRAFT_3125227 [Cantharellus anzutake]|uniref:uncharacterized protein n=1 Tax=Cantharellus anzutake TaxID=1750568 RepID=UPI0019047BD1|nr:uncharacterized protein EI90DRAFT_3125227 [Cantharellus anzutake]KAF8329456.1 hypothetical protein EI90DRAFT_3125227 [Cantharellus anzutake]
MDNVSISTDDIASEEGQGQTAVMPPALRLLDILTILFDGCPKATLASAAQTCKLWSIPALKRLWRVLDTLLPFLRLLFETWPPVSDNRNFEPRIQFYAQFVQSITVHIGYDSIHPLLTSVLTHAVQFLQPPPFQHLISLDCFFNGPEATREAGIWLAIRPPKISLSFLSSTEATYLSVIRSLYHHGASLTFLSLHMDKTSELSEAVKECIVNALKPLDNLACLAADGHILFTPTVWTCIAQLPNLEEVRSPFFKGGFHATSGSSAWLSFEPSTLDAPFPSLRTLEMVVPSKLAAIILGYYPLDGVHCLGLLLTDNKNDPPTEQSLIQIVTSCKSLHRLLLVAPYSRLPVLQLPLSPDLTHLVVCTDSVGTIDNADLVYLCSKTPNLEALELVPTRVLGNPRLTLEVIRSIAEVCPRLERVSLYVDTDVSGIRFSFDDAPIPSNHPLSTLCFTPSEVLNRSEVATYLCTLFRDAQRAPIIVALSVCFGRHFGWKWPIYEDSEEEWECVAEFMDTLWRRVVPSFRNRLGQKDAELEALRREPRS